MIFWMLIFFCVSCAQGKRADKLLEKMSSALEAAATDLARLVSEAKLAEWGNQKVRARLNHAHKR